MDADRTRDRGEGVQWPKDKKPMFYRGKVGNTSVAEDSCVGRTHLTRFAPSEQPIELPTPR